MKKIIPLCLMFFFMAGCSKPIISAYDYYENAPYADNFGVPEKLIVDVEEVKTNDEEETEEAIKETETVAETKVVRETEETKETDTTKNNVNIPPLSRLRLRGGFICLSKVMTEVKTLGLRDELGSSVTSVSRQ